MSAKSEYQLQLAYEILSFESPIICLFVVLSVGPRVTVRCVGMAEGQ